jgi:pimeloyl-ACP methyl ester carboxylesterase
MAIGAKDPVLGLPVMRELHKCISGCPEPMVLEEAGHFVQEWGEEVARAALGHLG